MEALVRLSRCLKKHQNKPNPGHLDFDQICRFVLALAPALGTTLVADDHLLSQSIAWFLFHAQPQVHTHSQPLIPDSSSNFAMERVLSGGNSHSCCQSRSGW